MRFSKFIINIIISYVCWDDVLGNFSTAVANGTFDRQTRIPNLRPSLTSDRYVNCIFGVFSEYLLEEAGKVRFGVHTHTAGEVRDCRVN